MDALPSELGEAFTVRQARTAGLSGRQLRHPRLDAPFHGVRSARRPLASPRDDPFENQRRRLSDAAHDYLPRLRPGQFFSHETAAALWAAPLPVSRDSARTADTRHVHVSTFGDGPLIRADGVIAHRAKPATSRVVNLRGLPVASAATTWASLGTLPLFDVVALGDYFCRVWRSGPGRPHPGRPPLCVIDDLRRAISAGRRVGNARLRQAVELIRQDAWSPRESALRCMIVLAGLPEPALNHDVYDDHGRFLGCVDLAYPERKIAIEYHGILHHAQYAKDVERIAALRAAGWIVLEVTATLFANRTELLSRIRAARRATVPV